MLHFRAHADRLLTLDLIDVTHALALCEGWLSIESSEPMRDLHAVDRIVESGKKRIGILGFSFKADTDDLRESPMVILSETLLGKGYELRIYDRNVSLSRLLGSNKESIERQIPHLSRYLCESIDDLIADSDVVVIGNPTPEFVEAATRCRADQLVIDLVRIPIDVRTLQAQYDGICW